MNKLHKVLNAELAAAQATDLFPLNEIELGLVGGGDGNTAEDTGATRKNFKALDGNPAI